ncbi:baseplate multidomain protein megatron [Polymorphum gilvum]|uniref:Gene transfer agent-like protein n=1 Tax=Polymorphum gilvum (strain LMG 25793 / CGMCC 1.9160 / SL003B-26A1) TaxID=991905 RepID=F2J6G8_POLGS|nr:glycoside hydrolase/phage tail family protein [Polymorphum gilvum]ADZ71342.1 Gene transfer agent-like protein [Polymorphum gilvum SL003B-26A1]
MATLILSAAGQALGGALGLGGFGAVLGRAAGAVAGTLVDQGLFGTSRTVQAGKLADLSVQASTEGAALPLVYGRVRLSGQVIWATRFEEEVSEERQGGKAGGSGGTTVRAHAYYANFAVALCQGPVARIGRIWADGKLLDIAGLTLRAYPGSADQPVDPLIAAHQSTAPAYRGTAHVVFERLALAPFGNRIPQLAFEVVRTVDTLEGLVRAVTLIPGAGEFVYAPAPVTDRPLPGTTESVNRHTMLAASDWHAALDELQALCPALESVALVVAWFGDDLRAGHCTVRPKVEANSRTTAGMTWSVGPLTRGAAQQVSYIDGRPAYGGTPADASVIAAIRDLRARGLRVVLYPFVMMDIAAGNGLPDPHGGAEQAAYPWRGRIVAAGDVAAEVATFMGTAVPGDFPVSGETVGYAGPDEWSYRRFVLHNAHLAQAAGGVDAFLIGSELRGLTRGHAGGGSYPFVDALRALAADVRAVTGAATKLSYAADWSEYGGHQVAAGALRFPLDPLWADPAIDFVGIDNYLPMTDLRDGGDPDGNDDPYDLALLRAGIAGGEYHDWFYASAADRGAGLRTPITDGAYGKPFVFRAKDLRGWWQNAHHERVGGVELAGPTPWQPASKPIWFTELGVPAIDRGANQPNVFVDPKSSESQLPHFSAGARDDLIQRRALEAALSYWDDRHPELPMGDNPLSPVYGGRMVDAANLHLWTFDARPFPAFPTFADVWADGANWQVGHWLNGRFGGAGLGAILRRMLADFGIAPEDVAVGSLPHALDGLTVAGPATAREVIEPLLDAFGCLAVDRGTRLELIRPPLVPVARLAGDDLVETDPDAPVLARVRAQAGELPAEVRLSGEDAASDFRRLVTASRRLEGASRHLETRDLAVVAPPETLLAAADRRLQRLWAERERVEFALPPTALALEPGDLVELDGAPGQAFEPALKLRIEAIEDGPARRIEAMRTEPAATLAASPRPRAGAWRSADLGPPHALMLDLSKLSDGDADRAPRLAVFARPWPGGYALLRSATESGFQPVATVDRPATVGRLAEPLAPGPVWLWDEATRPLVELYGGTLESRDPAAVLAGANALAVRTAAGGFEILQFRGAELVGPRLYRLSGLLRGQRGTEAEAGAGAPAGADVVRLDAAVAQVPLDDDLAGLPLAYRLVPQGRSLDDPASLGLSHAASGRGAQPLSPVHVRARRTAAGIVLAWIRRSRIGADGWEQLEVPLGEAAEAYEVDVLDGAAVLRTLRATTPEVLYPAAEELADFGAPVANLTVAVVQLSETAGRGQPAKAILHV